MYSEEIVNFIHGFVTELENSERFHPQSQVLLS